MSARTHPVTILLIILSTHGVRLCGGEACNSSLLSSKLELLFAEYDRESPPPGAGPLQVELALEPHHAAVDDRAATVRLLADLHIRWSDSRLLWNTSEVGCSSALVSAEQLWVPDVEPWGGGSGAAELQSARISAGRVAWQTRVDVTVPLQMDLADWPNDRQAVTFVFASRQHPIEEMNFTIFEVKSLVFDASGWESVSVVADAGTSPRGEQGTWSVSRWQLVLRRRAAAQVWCARAVLWCALALLCAAALLPPARRPPLAATASLVAALWLTSCVGRVSGSATCPRVVTLLCIVCACGGAWCACAAALRRLAAVATTPPHHLRAVLNKCKLTPIEGTGVSGGGAAWAAAAQLLDHVLLAALAATLLVATACLAV